MIRMTRYAFIDTQTGEIKGIIDTPDPDSLTPGEVNVEGLLVVGVPEDISPNIAITNWYYVNTGDLATGYFAQRPTSPADYYDWTSYEWTLNSERLWAAVRAKRDSLLKQADWTQLPDAPLTDNEKLAWNAYRQELRDVPSNNPNIQFVEAISWPTPPSFIA